MTLLKRSLTYYWRTHLALIWGVATAVAVLAGALLVGESVRESLRSLFLGRLGNVEYVVSALDFFAEDLADDIEAHEDFRGTFRETSPLIALEGFVIHEKSGRRSSRVQVYGIDERFWVFHGLELSSPAPPSGRDAVLTEGLALELNSSPGDTILLRVERPYDVPGEQVVVLEYETHSLVSKGGDLLFLEIIGIAASESHSTRSGRLERAENIEQSALATA